MDGLCPAEYSEWAYSMVNSPQKFIRYERGGHGAPALKNHDSYVRQMIQTIETGQADIDDDESKAPFFDIIIQSLFAKLLF